MHRLFSGWMVAMLLGLLPALVFFLSQGVLSLYGEGVHLVALVLAGSTLLVSIGAVIWFNLSKRRSGLPEHEIVDLVEANPVWGPEQTQTWAIACDYIDELLKENEQIEILHHHSLSVLRKVASVWNGSGSNLEYSVTLPEALLAVETLAARYRSVLLKNVPLSNRIKISKALSLWSFYEKNETAMKHTYRAYRLYRSFSVSGIFSELGSLIAGQLSEPAQKNLAYNLKRAYLQEVANVAIDLYSGNFRRALNELPIEQENKSDIDRLAADVGPIRIVVVGQISSGKSTLINVLLNEFKAESGLVPTTDTERVYKFSIADGLDTHIVDTPGIAADSHSIKDGVERLANADIVIWVMRANQPGRNIDQELHTAFERVFDKAPDRQKPVVLLAATHIDCIPAFTGVDEKNLQTVTAPLAAVCAKAVRYDAFCPLVLKETVLKERVLEGRVVEDGEEKEHMLGVDGLRNTLADQYDRAINTRLNRIRAMRPGFYQTASEELGSLKSGTLKAIRLALTKRFDTD